MHRAIVTGGSRGIGRAIAAALVAAGGQVLITGRDQAVLDAAVGDLTQGPGRALGVRVDVRDRPGIAALVDRAAREFGGLDVLVNNAGVGVFASAAEMTDDEWDSVMDINVTGVFNCTRAAIPVMRKGGGGWIVNIASLAGKNPSARGGAYCASKAAVIAFSECVMQEVRHEDIRVSVILPGSVSTEFSGPRGGGEAPWKLQPNDIAEVVMDLLRHPARSLPSRVEIRPSRPQR